MQVCIDAVLERDGQSDSDVKNPQSLVSGLILTNFVEWENRLARKTQKKSYETVPRYKKHIYTLMKRKYTFITFLFILNKINSCQIGKTMLQNFFSLRQLVFSSRWQLIYFIAHCHNGVIFANSIIIQKRQSIERLEFNCNVWARWMVLMACLSLYL